MSFRLFNQTKVALLQERLSVINAGSQHYMTALTRTINAFPLRDYLIAYLPPTLYFFADLFLDICEYYSYEVCLAAFIVVMTIYWSFYKTPEERYSIQLGKCWKDLVYFCETNNHSPILLRLAWSDAVSFDHTLDPTSRILSTEYGGTSVGYLNMGNTHKLYPVPAGWPGCGGCNGSIRFESELQDPSNAGLHYAIAILQPFKLKYKTISWADLIQMSAVAVIYTSGGPYIDLRYGREDCMIDLRDSDEDYRSQLYSRKSGAGHGCLFMNSEDMKLRYFPCVHPPYPLGEKTTGIHLRGIFSRLGLSNREAVALCGAHTIGRAFKDRTGVCDSSSGDQNGPYYTKTSSTTHGRDPAKLKPNSGISGGKKMSTTFFCLC